MWYNDGCSCLFPEERAPAPWGGVVRLGPSCPTTKITEGIFHACGSGLCGARAEPKGDYTGGTKENHPCQLPIPGSVALSATHPHSRASGIAN